MAPIAQPLPEAHSRLARVRPSVRVGLAMLATLLFVAIAAGKLTAYDATRHDYSVLLQPPSRLHLFGTDNFGRDVFARVLHGTSIDLWIGLLSVIFPFAFGSLAGALAGFFGGWVDTVVMRTVDMVTAFPSLVLVIALVAFLGGGFTNMLIAIGAVGWVPYARLVRAEVLVQRGMEYVQAARALGYNRWRILFRHITPNAITPAFVFMVTDVVQSLLAVSSLGFLGLGVLPPAPEWGLMIAEGRAFLFNAWWIATMPGLACLYAGLTFSLLGDGVSDLLRAKGQ